MKKINASLAQFSKFISTCLIGGTLSLFLGIVLFFLNSETVNPLGIFSAGFSFYLSSMAFGLAIVGAFLRQTARVIVEGLDGNLREDAFGLETSGSEAAANTSDTPKVQAQPMTPADLLRIRLGWLSGAERARWESLGSPDISAWDGSIKFDKWIEQQGRK
jgi:hypothetical protein